MVEDALLVEVLGGDVVEGFRVVGELDLFSSPRLVAVVEANGPRLAPVVTIDVSELGFCDSTGLYSLVDCQRVAAANGSRMRLGRPSASLRRILELTGLLELFDTEN